ncbi:hypothetical protein TNCV_2453591 [Trichonephila clavipes]|nr:hypothetical protein TNCV_2453591 [Trichonephila clavipes]
MIGNVYVGISVGSVISTPLMCQTEATQLAPQCYRFSQRRYQEDWARVLFTDESRYSLNTDSRRVLIWREEAPLLDHEIHRFHDRDFMFWRRIMTNGHTELHIFPLGMIEDDFLKLNLLKVTQLYVETHNGIMTITTGAVVAYCIENGTRRRRSNLELYHLYKESDIANLIKIQRIKWADHVVRIDEDLTTKKFSMPNQLEHGERAGQNLDGLYTQKNIS